MIAGVYVLFAIALGGGVAAIAFKESRSDIYNITIAWMLITGSVFFIKIPFVCFLIILFVLVVFKPKRDVNRLLLYYIAMLPVLPTFFRWDVSASFLPINRLFFLHYYDLVNLIYLLPLATLTANSGGGVWKDQGYLNAEKLRKLIIFLLVYVLILGFRGTSLTDGLRSFLQGSMSLLLIIFAFKNLYEQKKLIAYVMQGVLISGCIMAFIGFFQYWKLWKFYTELPYSLVGENLLYQMTEVRGGGMRVASTMNPLSFGFYMTICAGVIFQYMRNESWTFWGRVLLGVYIYGLILTNSRGGILGLLIMLAVYYLYDSKYQQLRKSILSMRWIMIIIMIPLVSSGINYLVKIDENGTFLYRVDLVSNSLLAAKDNIMLGSANFLDHPAMQASKQGQGIIDITNSYLGLLLENGLIGLGLFVYIGFTLLKKLIRLRRQAFDCGNIGLERNLCLIISILVAFDVVIFTVSFVDLLEHYYWIFSCLGIMLLASNLNQSNHHGRLN